MTDEELPTDLTKAYLICGAQKSQSEGACTRPSGWGTDHPGEGRCKLHGGGSPIRTGRYSVIKRERIRELIAQFEEDPNPLDMTPELVTCRALFVDYVERYDEFTEQLKAWHQSYDGDSPTAKPPLGVSGNRHGVHLPRKPSWSVWA